MIENLFSSKVMFLVLETLFDHPEESMSTTEIIERTGKHQTSVMRELEKLAGWKLVTKKRVGNLNHFRLDQDSPSFVPLKKLFDEYSKIGGGYFLIAEEGGVSLLSLHYFTRGYTSDYAVKKGVISSVSEIICHYQDDYGRFYFEKEHYERCGRESFDKLIEDPSFVEELIYKESVEYGEQALEIYGRLKQEGFRMGKRQAVEMLQKFEEIIARQISLGYIAVFDLKDQRYSKYLKGYLSERIDGTELKLHATLQKLLEPTETTHTQRLHSVMVNLAIESKSGNTGTDSELRRIWRDWLWLNYGYRGPAYDFDYFQQVLDELCNKDKAELRREAAELKEHADKIIREKDRLCSKLGIDKEHRKFIDALSQLSFLKVYRKDTAFLLIYMTYEILKQFNRKYKQKELYYLTLDEAVELIEGRLKVSRSELRKREHNSVYLGKEEKILLGKEADKYVDLMVGKEEAQVAKNGQLRMLEGMTACLGRTGDWVRGKVKIINVSEDMDKMEDGDILISVTTTPDILPAMKKASAIVTDHGGITCHAAVVSRELDIPCLIAVKYATKVFKDGDAVIVCPRHGYIKYQ
ncbi:MAG: PEP-utilizing enzyme [Patescibacteria group bacterium]|nr:PEP-utilizing enzyme [Patescibacteria group bacterium]